MKTTKYALAVALGLIVLVVPSVRADTITTTANPGGLVILGGGVIILNDTATLSGGSSPTGVITFNLSFGGQVIDTGVVTLTNGNGTYSFPGGFAVPPISLFTGTYQWDVSYSGDANNAAVSDINDPNGQVIVSLPAVSAVPEPSSISLMLAGLGLLGLKLAMRKRKAHDLAQAT